MFSNLQHLKVVAQQLLMLVQFELSRLLATKRGWLSIAAFIAVWSVILRYAILPAADLMRDPSFQDTLSKAFGVIGLRHINSWPMPEISLYWLISLLMLPLSAMAFTANQTCTDISRGTFRFYAVRMSRPAIVLGRFLGNWLVQGVFIAVSLLVTFAVAAWRLQTFDWQWLSVAAGIWLNLLIVIAPFTALMALFSAAFSTTRMVLTMSTLALIAVMLVLAYLIYLQPQWYSIANYQLGMQVPELLKANLANTPNYWLLPLVQSVLLLAGSVLVIKRKAL